MRWVTAVAVLLLLTGVAAAQPAPDPLREAARREGRVTFYTTALAQVADTMRQRAEAALGIKVEIIRASSGTLFSRVLMEQRAGIRDVDVLETGILEQFTDLKRSRLLAAYAPRARFLDPAYADPEHFWEASRLTIATIIYNRDRLSPAQAPHAWRDLADPRFAGKIIQGDPKSSAIGALVVYNLVKLYGWEFYDTLRAHDVLTQPSCDVVQFLASAERLLAPCDNNNAVLGAQQGLPIASVFPEEGVFALIGPVGIMASAPHPNAARLFLEWLLSPDGQNIHTASGAISPVDAPGITYPPGTPSPSAMHVLLPDPAGFGAWLEQGRARFADLFGG